MARLPLGSVARPKAKEKPAGIPCPAAIPAVGWLPWSHGRWQVSAQVTVALGVPIACYLAAAPESSRRTRLLAFAYIPVGFVGLALSVLKVIYARTHFNVRTETDDRLQRTDVYLIGADSSQGPDTGTGSPYLR